MKVLAIAVLAAIGSPPAASADANDVDGVIRNLDLTTFPNAIGPMRPLHKTTFADYCFVVVAKTTTGATLVRKDGGSKHFVVLSNDPKHMRLCFYDSFLVWLGGTSRTYSTTSALLATKSRRDRWSAEPVRGGFPACQNSPPAT